MYDTPCLPWSRSPFLDLHRNPPNRSCRALDSKPVQSGQVSGETLESAQTAIKIWGTGVILIVRHTIDKL
jgi:hypothetical protein